MKEFNIGDKVVVTDAGRNYGTYDEWIKENAPTYLERWKNRTSRIPNDILFNKKAGKIVVKNPHTKPDDMFLYLIDFGEDYIYLFDGLGIKLSNQNYCYTVQGKQHIVIVE